MDADETQVPEGAVEPGTTELEATPGASPEPLTVGNGSQVIAVTINLNVPILGPVVYASRHAMPPAVGGRIFDVVRRVVGGPRPDAEAAAEPEVEPAAESEEGAEEGAEPIPTDPSG